MKNLNSDGGFVDQYGEWMSTLRRAVQFVDIADETYTPVWFTVHNALGPRVIEGIVHENHSIRR